jgi:hypothetical protein
MQIGAADSAKCDLNEDIMGAERRDGKGLDRHCALPTVDGHMHGGITGSEASVRLAAFDHLCLTCHGTSLRSAWDELWWIMSPERGFAVALLTGRGMYQRYDFTHKSAERLVRGIVP